MGRNGRIEGGHSAMYRAPKILEKSDEHVAHKVRDYIINVGMCMERKGMGPTLPLTSDVVGGCLAKGSAEYCSHGFGLVLGLLWCGSVDSLKLDLAHDAE